MNFKLLAFFAVILFVSVAVCDQTTEPDLKGTINNKDGVTHCGGVACGDGSFAHYYTCNSDDKCSFRLQIWVYIAAAVLVCSCIIACVLFCLCKK